MLGSKRPFLVILALASLAGTISAAELGRCRTAQLHSSVVLPDGSTHGPGPLKICLTRQHSPVAALHETWVGDRPVGLFPSRLGTAEGGAGGDEAFFVFERRFGGDLILQGYAVREGDGLRTYSLVPRSNGGADVEVTSRWALTSLREAGSAGGLTTLLALN